MQKYAEKFYKGKQWQATREAYSTSQKHLCENCREQGILTAGVIVHHIKPISRANINRPEITLNFDNLRLLCRACHEKAHHKPKARYIVDALGNVTPIGD